MGHARSKATQSRVAGGHGAWGMEHGAWGMEHGAWSMGLRTEFVYYDSSPPELRRGTVTINRDGAWSVKIADNN